MPEHRGRPAIGPQMSIRLPPDLIEQIEVLAAERGQRRADVIRDLLWLSFERVFRAAIDEQQ